MRKFQLLLWSPIESAPRDGTLIEVPDLDHFCVVSWSGTRWATPEGHEAGNPTQWRPLSEPPRCFRARWQGGDPRSLLRGLGRATIVVLAPEAGATGWSAHVLSVDSDLDRVVSSVLSWVIKGEPWPQNWLWVLAPDPIHAQVRGT